jgi:putative Mg2+ transporter-C (MgtC) family protein
MDLWTLSGRLALAFLLGGLVGWERERGDKPAGLRTLILVSTGSALFALMSLLVIEMTQGTTPSDPLRIVAGIAQGIGFLGAGTILVTRGAVHGLTTAASIWATAAIGTACGFGFWHIALMGTVLTFSALRLLGALERHIGSR